MDGRDDIRGDTRDTRLEDDRPVVVRTPADDRPVVVHTADRPPLEAEGRRRHLLVAAGAVVLVVAVAALGWVALRNDDSTAGTRSAPAAAEPAGPAPLSLVVQVPGSVVAGQPATLTVRYEDGAGTYSGSQEDWGDGVGTSSLKQGRCGAGGATAAQAGSYQATHTWAAPGSYTVTVAVTSYTCEDGVAVEEQASRTVTVTVAGS